MSNRTVIDDILLILWGISLFIGASMAVYLIVELFRNENFIEDNSSLLSAFFILLSASVASASVMKSIENTTNIEKEKNNQSKQIDYAYLSNIMDTIFFEIDKSKFLYPSKDIKDNPKQFDAYMMHNEKIIIHTLLKSEKMFINSLSNLKTHKNLHLYESLNVFLQGLTLLLNELVTTIELKKDLLLEEPSDLHDAHFFNGMQVVYMQFESIEEILYKLNNILLERIPNIQMKSKINQNLLLSEDNLDLAFHKRVMLYASS